MGGSATGQRHRIISIDGQPHRYGANSSPDVAGMTDHPVVTPPAHRGLVLATDIAWPDLDLESSILAPAGYRVELAPHGSAADLAEAARDAIAIMTNWRTVPAIVLEKASGCGTIARYGVGIDNIAVDRATELGMVVTNVPDYCTEEVADHAIALTMALIRQLGPTTRSTSQGVWQSRTPNPVRRLSALTFGVIGLGRIGQLTAAKAAGLGMRVVGFSPSGAREEIPGIERLELAELLRQSDVVSLHVPLVAQTRGLLGSPQLDLMKPSAYLVNTARGGVVDLDALTVALVARSIAGAALDVLDQEPPAADLPLLALDNVLVTPHVAFASVDSITDLRVRTARNVLEVLAGRRPESVVNPSVYERAAISVT